MDDNTDAVPLLNTNNNMNINNLQGVSYEKLDNNNSDNDNSDNNDNNSIIDKTTHVIHNKLGTINGCYVPCLLNIMGIVLFERLGWGIGQIGVSGVFAVFCIAEFQAIITVLSLSAIVTNGNMRGGGSYYMISRTLGPEFGGSIGLLFYAAYCVGVAFYCTGFAEEVVKTWFDSETGSSYHWILVLVASIINFICLLVALGGARWFTKINVFLFFWQFLSILIALLACFFRPEFHLSGQTNPCQTTPVVENYTHFAWSWDSFIKMWSFDCSSGDCATFAITFGVLFPAATGIMEGANLSGDLANPTYSIPVGTLSALGTSIAFYTLLIIAFAGTFNQCTLRNDTTIMQESAWGDVGTYLVVAGIVISASSSALGSMFGGSRVLQAIARDKLFPYTKIFEYGTKKGDEPRNAVLLTWIIAQALIFLGSINTIAPIATSFFCLSYCTVNFSCFLLEISGTPNFRPGFTYYTWHTALLGTISNLAVMFFVDYKFGLAALICEITIFVYLAYRAPQNVWGDVTQSIIFHQVRKYLLRLDSRKAHSKTWRPSILLLADTEDLALIDFCNNLKKGGLYIIGSIIIGDFCNYVELTSKIKNDWIEFVDKNHLKAFPQIAISNKARSGYENLILLSGLGAMEPNTIVIPMLRIINPKKQKQKPDDDDIDDDDDDEKKNDNDNDDSLSELLHGKQKSSMDLAIIESLKQLVTITPAEIDPIEYIKLCENILKFNRNIVMTANMHSLDYQLVVSQNIQEFVEKITTTNADNNNNNNSDKVEIIDTTVSINRNDSSKSNIIHHRNQSSTSVLGTNTNYWTFQEHKSPNIENKWVDIWLFASDYTFNISDNRFDDGFPMLIMQLAHILLQNKVWDKAAGLRVFLMVNDKWNESDQNEFDNIIKELRLGIDQVVVLKEPTFKKPNYKSIINGNKKKKHLKKYYSILNNTMVTLSSQTYFTFIKLPELPKQIYYNQLSNIYFESLYILLKNMPPTALIATGEELPVISMDI